MKNKLLIALIAAAVVGSAQAASSSFKIINATNTEISGKVNVVSWLCSDQPFTIKPGEAFESYSKCCVRGVTITSPEYLEADTSAVQSGAGIICNANWQVVVGRDANTKAMKAILQAW